MTTKPLGKITALLADLGLEVTYAYDDLVFVQECAFLLQFTDQPTALKMFINTECDPDEANTVAANMISEFGKGGFTAQSSGQYTITANDDQTIDLKFE